MAPYIYRWFRLVQALVPGTQSRVDALPAVE